MPDVLVVGAGPAGWAAAAALRGEGLDVTLVAPDPQAPFRNGYGVWVDEIEGLGLDDVLERTWTAARVHVGAGPGVRLDRRYARIENGRLRARLMERASGAVLEQGAVLAVTPVVGEDTLEARLSGGRVCRARIVIDASGHESRLLVQSAGPQPGWQVAYGRRIEVDRHPFPLDEAVLMDFRLAEESFAARVEPSFLYALPESPNVVFVEETSLVARPAVRIEAMEARLDARLRRLGIRARRVLDVERCFIPMGGPPPPEAQTVVGFGGAARMVHPATGYLLARVLRTAPRLARAARIALDRGEDRDARARRLWNAVWSPAERSAHDLFRFGTEVLVELDTATIESFFAAFFSLPDEDWRTYLAGTAGPTAVRRAMRGVFARAPWALRWRLARAGLAPKGAPCRRSLFARG